MGREQKEVATNGMTDIAELQSSVMQDPADYEARWRLAKKLYLACEYQQALDHLLVLKSKWSRRLNVLRYLAATFYRLGMYTEAIEELKDALSMWPTEVGLMEQLARVHEAAGNKEDASQVWADILDRNTDHPLASSAIRRLRTTRSESVVDNLGLGESDSGIHLMTGVMCAQCGARNSLDFDRCWQCHALLQKGTPQPHKHNRANNSAYVSSMFIALINVILLALGAYVTVRQMRFIESLGSNDSDGMTVYALFVDELGIARITSGILLLILWPLALEFMLAQIKAGHQRPVGAFGVGTFLALATYLTFWLPVQVMMFAPLSMAVGSFVALMLLMRLEFKQAMKVWVVQGVVALLVTLTTFAAFAGSDLVIESPAIVSHAAKVDSKVREDRVLRVKGSLPVDSTIQWDTTGSTWLDQKGAAVRITVKTDIRREIPPSLELSSDNETVLIRDITMPTSEFTAQIQPGKPYQLRIKSSAQPDGKDLKVEIDVEGVLIPRFLQ